MNKQNTEQLKKEFKMVLDDAFEDKSYLSDKPQMNEEDALFEQVLDVVWNFFLPHLISSDEIKREAVEGFVSNAGKKFREFCDLVRKELDIFVMVADVESEDVQDWEYMQSFDSFLYFPVAEDDEENTIYYKTSFTPLEILLHEDAWKDIIEQIRTSKKTYLTQQSLDKGDK